MHPEHWKRASFIDEILSLKTFHSTRSDPRPATVFSGRDDLMAKIMLPLPEENIAERYYNTLAEKFVFEVDLFFDPISYWEPHLRKMREILTTDQINPAQLSFVF